MTHTHPITIALSGLGGYGEQYLNELLDPRYEGRVTLAGGIDPQPERCTRLADLRARGAPIYQTLADFYQEHSADLLIVSAPIHEHAPQTCLGLAHGSHVLCEKPLAATVQEADAMIAARDKAGTTVAIGYQWSFDPVILSLKRDIMAGHFGRPLRLSTVALWPRTAAYYARNNWAGRQKAPSGAWVLDSPANNAVAHYLHNMLFLLGARIDRSVTPLNVQAELYRANPIENYDTAALRVAVEGGAEILFYASHAVSESFGPVLRAEFENGTIHMDGLSGRLTARTRAGAQIDYGVPDNGVRAKLEASLNAIERGAPVTCGIEAARAHTVCINGAQESAEEIADFDPAQISHMDAQDGRLTFVAGLGEALRQCAEAGKLPSEMGFAWARPGRMIDLRGYAIFPSGK